MVEVGRIRMGNQVAYRKQDGTTGYRAAKLEHFRFTSRDQSRLAVVAELYGGAVKPWEARAGEFEVYSAATEVPILIIPGQTISQWWELWSGGGCQRRCDGEHEIKSAAEDVPCICNTERGDRKCKPTTRLSVMLPDVPGLGVWRLESHGWYAAVELAGTAAMLEAATAQGKFLPARLRIDQRSKVDEGKTTRYAVPVIDIDITVRQALPSAVDGPVAALEAGAPPALPAGHTPIEGARGVTLEEGLQAVAGEREPRRTGRQAAPIGPASDEALFGPSAPLPVDTGPDVAGDGDDPECISEAQKKLLWTTVREGGVEEQALRAVVAEVTGQESTKLIPRGSFDKVLKGVERLVKQAALETDDEEVAALVRLLLAFADERGPEFRARCETSVVSNRAAHSRDEHVAWLEGQIERARAAAPAGAAS